jgi:Lrp/AsnC family leucine-responsive transcriptional regulator
MLTNGQPDPTDIKILNILQQDARIDVSKLSLLVHKSASPVAERVRRLKENGYIQRYVAVLNRNLLGWPTMMITLVKLNRHAAITLRDFALQMSGIPEVQVCLHLSGEFDFLLQVTLRDPQSYEDFLMERLLSLPMVEKVQSSLVLKECKIMGALPLI